MLAAASLLQNSIVAIIWIGVIAYAVFGGADFGSGFWDLLAGGDQAGAAPRKRIDRSIGPVWEANHVWLIFVLVFLWTGVPTAFAALMTGVFVPFVAVAVGIVFRGGAFVFRKSATSVAQARFFGFLFASSSVVTPFFLGAIAGAVASGRIPPDGGSVNAWSVWITPTSMLGGVLAVGACAWLAAVFMAADAARDGEQELTEYFGKRAMASGVAIGVISLVGIAVVELDAPTLADGLETWAAPLVVLSAAGGLGAMWMIRQGRHASARVPATIAVVAVMLGWGVGQYPWVLVDELEIADAASPDATLWALLITFLLAGLLAVPPLVWLLKITHDGDLSTHKIRSDSSLAKLQELD